MAKRKARCKKSSRQERKEVLRTIGMIIVIGVVIVALLIAFRWLYDRFPVATSIVFLLLGAVLVLLCDQSGLRQWCANRLPDSRLTQWLLKQRKPTDRFTEICKTVGYFGILLWLVFLRWQPLISKLCFIGILPLLPIAFVRHIWLARRQPKLSLDTEDNNGNQPLGSLCLAVELFLLIISDIHNQDYSLAFWCVCVLLFLIPLSLYGILVPPRASNPKRKKKPHNALWLILCAAGFAFLATNTVNWYLDPFPPQTVGSPIMDTRESSGGKGGPHYFIIVAPFGDRTEELEIEVDHPTYEAAEIGEDATVIVHQGLLCPWYELTVEGEHGGNT
ncbi:MAG: hypothetical protein IJZ13_00025 [Clostridia bacterium]|nr:hypothetical protein [Clostridia bacterium]